MNKDYQILNIVRSVFSFVLIVAIVAPLFSLPQEASALEDSDFTAAGAIVVDADTGDILYGKNIDTQLRPASMIKMMTLLLALEYASSSMSQEVTVQSYAASVGGTTARLAAGARYTLEELMYGMMLPSGNDAATAIAAHIGSAYLGGSTSTPETSAGLFIAEMNQRASELGMTNTNYENPHGLDATGHVSTARDMIALTQELM